MKKGINIYKLRNESDLVKIEELELQYNIILPLLYKSFARLFYLGIDFISAMPMHTEETYYLEKQDEFISLEYGINYNIKGDFSFIGFYDIKYALDWYSEKIQNPKCMFIKESVFPIGPIDGQGDVCVGMHESNLDDIFVVNHELKTIQKIDDNIFSFIANFTSAPNSLLERKGINVHNIYKNWNEDFWRVREKNE